ncbi:MAG: glycosyltransferase family 2 protein [Candidatus Methanomethylicaceae archaeon]
MCVTCIIVNWNSKRYVYDCLRSIEERALDVITECIVVDSASFDGVETLIMENFRWARFLQLETNVGFGAANNIGSMYSTKEYILFLNPDTNLMPGCVTALVEAMYALPKAGIVGPKVLNSDGTIQTSCVQSDPTPWGEAIDSELLRTLFPRWKVWGNFSAFSSQEPTSVDAVSGACMLVKKSVFQTLGGFRNDYFMYAEDLDLCYRARKKGYEVYHVPRAGVIHYGGSSSSVHSTVWGTLMLRKSLETYMKLNQGDFSAFLYRLLQGVSAMIRLCLLSPGLIFAQKTKRHATKTSVNKWWNVLLWSLGASRIFI